MKIAFMIIAHTDIDQLMRLCNKLVDYGNVYIHVDKRTDDDFLFRLTQFVESNNLCQKISVLKDRVNVTWGGYSMVNAIVKLLEATLDETEPKYDRIFLLSGLCYPLFSPKMLFRYCEEHKGKELLMAYNITRGSDKRNKQRVVLYHFFRNINLPHKSFIRRGIIGGSKLFFKYLQIRKKPYIVINKNRWDVYYSSEWVSLTNCCWKFVLDNLQHNKEIINYFKYSYAPDEMVVPTIVMNSKYRKFAFVSQKPGLENLSLLHFLHYTNHIWTYDEKDYETLIDSGKPFVRKLVSGRSEKLIEIINKYHNKNGV